MAGQQKAEMDAIATEFLDQFPVTQTNDSARELARLSANLGLASSDQSETAPQVDDEQKAEALEAISEILGNYLERQGQRPEVPWRLCQRS